MKVVLFSRSTSWICEPDGTVTASPTLRRFDLWMNGGYLMFRREIFHYLGEDDGLIEEPFHRLIADDQLVTYRYEGFWISMDTLKDLQNLQALYEGGQPPWAVWLGAHRA
jgi:glucose-1-phosphate cytidylyltransferase